MEKSKVAIIGITHPHSGGYRETFKLIPEAEITALYDTDEDAVNILDDGLAKKPFYTDFDAMLRDENLDLAMVLLPNNQAPEAIIKLANAGIHCIAEKPVARNAAELQKAVDIANKNSVKLGVGYPWRFQPIAKEIKKLITEGKLGKLYSIETRMVTSNVKSRNPKHYLFSKEISGGGILNWLGVHWFDLMHFFIDSDVKSVSAIVSNVGGEDIDVEDIASVSLLFKNGVVGTMHAGYVLPDGYETFIGIRGSLGWVRWDTQKPQFDAKSLSPDWKDNPERHFSYTFPESKAYGGQWGLDFIHDFVLAVRENRAPAANGEDGVWVLQVVDAAYKSSRIGRTVEIPA